MIKKILFKSIFAVLMISAFACKKDYFTDSGVHDPNYPGSIYKYLSDKPVLFDSLTQVIDIAGMQEIFENKEITFFAPTSSSVYQAVRSLNEYLNARGQDTVVNLNQIKPEVWKDMLEQYIFEGKYVLKDFPQLDTTEIDAYPGQGFTSLNGRAMNIGVIHNDAGGVKYAGYRQLFLSYIYDLSNPKQGMLNFPVASSDIQPTNGAVHVLKFQNHIFGFQSSNFILNATSKGINPITN